MAGRATKAAAPSKAKAEAEAPEYAKYLEKEPTEVHENCAEWIADKTGYADIDLKTVQLVLSLYSRFQRSPENQEHLSARRQSASEAKAARAERAKKASATKEEPVKRSGGRKAVAEDEDTVEESPRRGKGRATAVAPAKRTTGRRRPKDDEVD